MPVLLPWLMRKKRAPKYYAFTASNSISRVSGLEIKNPLSTVSTFVSVAASPWGVDVLPGGRHAIVSCQGGSITPVDLANPLVPVAGPNVAVGTQLHGICASPDGQTGLVVDTLGGRLYSLNLANPMAPVVGGYYPLGATTFKLVAISPLGTFAVLGGSSNTLYFVGLSNPLAPSIYASLTLTAYPTGLAFLPSGSHVLIVLGNSIVAINVTNPAVPVAGTPVSIGTGATAIAIAPNGLSALVTGLPYNNLWAISLANPMVPIVINPAIGCGSNPYGVAISPDGKYAIATCVGSASARLIDLANPLLPVARGSTSIGPTPYSMSPHSFIYAR